MKKISRIIAIIMLVIALVFIIYAINHPWLSWPWSNKITFLIYFVYLLVIIILFIFSFKDK